MRAHGPGYGSGSEGLGAASRLYCGLLDPVPVGLPHPGHFRIASVATHLKHTSPFGRCRLQGLPQLQCHAHPGPVPDRSSHVGVNPAAVVHLQVVPGLKQFFKLGIALRTKVVMTILTTFRDEVSSRSLNSTALRATKLSQQRLCVTPKRRPQQLRWSQAATSPGRRPPRQPARTALTFGDPPGHGPAGFLIRISRMLRRSSPRSEAGGLVADLDEPYAPGDLDLRRLRPRGFDNGPSLAPLRLAPFDGAPPCCDRRAHGRVLATGLALLSALVPTTSPSAARGRRLAQLDLALNDCIREPIACRAW